MSSFSGRASSLSAPYQIPSPLPTDAPRRRQPDRRTRSESRQEDIGPYVHGRQGPVEVICREGDDVDAGLQARASSFSGLRGRDNDPRARLAVS